jgi:hypothetical protein
MGGVMGLGAKEVAIGHAQFHDMPAAPGTGAKAELKVPLTREQLAAVPEFKPLPGPVSVRWTKGNQDIQLGMAHVPPCPGLRPCGHGGTSL